MPTSAYFSQRKFFSLGIRSGPTHFSNNLKVYFNLQIMKHCSNNVDASFYYRSFLQRQLAERLIKMQLVLKTLALLDLFCSVSGLTLLQLCGKCINLGAVKVFREVLTFYGCNYFMNDHNVLSLRVIFHSELWCFTALIFSWILQSPESSRAETAGFITAGLSPGKPDIK